jgi:hypothetical protein
MILAQGAGRRERAAVGKPEGGIGARVRFLREGAHSTIGSCLLPD